MILLDCWRSYSRMQNSFVYIYSSGGICRSHVSPIRQSDIFKFITVADRNNLFRSFGIIPDSDRSINCMWFDISCQQRYVFKSTLMRGNGRVNLVELSGVRFEPETMWTCFVFGIIETALETVLVPFYRRLEKIEWKMWISTWRVVGVTVWVEWSAIIRFLWNSSGTMHHGWKLNM